MDHDYAVPDCVPFKTLALIFDKPFILKCVKSDLPIEKRVVYVLTKKRRHVNILKQKCQQSQDKIVDFLREEAEVLVNQIFKNLSTSVIDFITTHLKGAKRSKNKTWTLEEQISCVTFLIKNPIHYTLLRRFLILPSPNTLSNLLAKIPFDFGINEQLIQHLAQCLGSFRSKQKMCCLAFGEINIKANIHYSSSLDAIDGIVQLGKTQGRRCRIASKVLVFMAQGVVKKWKQPIAYYFSHSDIDSVELESIIREVVGSLFRVGIRVVGTICNLNTKYVDTLRMMGSSVFNPFFVHENCKIYTIFNPSHLLLCTRDIFQKFPVTFPYKLDAEDEEVIMTARWEHIRKVHEFNQGREVRIFPCVEDHHLAPTGPLKKKVSLAVQLLSRIMAAYINFFACISNDSILPPDAKGTAIFVPTINNLFDSLNGDGSFIDGDVIQYRSAVNRKSCHLKFWDETFELIHNWTFEGAKPPPLVQDGWLITINAVKSLWLVLRQKGIQKFCTRVLSNDPIDNLFTAIRAGCGNKNKPTAREFVNFLKVQILNGLLCNERHGANCEQDDLLLLSSLQTFLNAEPVQSGTSGTNNIFSDNSTHAANQIVKTIFSNNIIALSVVNLGAIIARIILAKTDCKKCANILTFKAPLPSSDSKTAPQESSDNQSIQTNPTKQFVITVGCCMTLVEQLLPNKLQDTELKNKLVTILNEQIDFSWIDCTLHFNTIKKCTVETVCSTITPWYCKYLIHDIEKHNRVSRRKVQQKAHTVQH